MNLCLTHLNVSKGDAAFKCFCLFNQFCLEKVDCAVFIVSSTGEGEPPETAMKFWRKLKRPALPKDHLAHLNFTVLGTI